jgi:hypothetical protein
MNQPETPYEIASYDLNKFRERRMADRRFNPRGTADRRVQPQAANPGAQEKQGNPGAKAGTN